MGDGTFPGIRAGSAKERKLERCVLKLKSEGKSKSSAIAICRAAMNRKGKKAMSPKSKDQIRKEKRREKRKQKKLADEELKALEGLDKEEQDLLLKTMGVDDEEIEEDESLDIELDLKEGREIEYNDEQLDQLGEWMDQLDVEDEPEEDSEEELEISIEEDIEEEKSFLETYFEPEYEETFEDLQLNVLAAEWSAWDGLKAVLSSPSRRALPDNAFALVATRNGKKVRKYPIHDKAHVQNALARAAQVIKRGGQPAKDAKAALPKIKAAAKKMGIGQPGEKKENGFFIEKDKEGDFRWVGWVSGKFIDREGEIISEAAHKEFVEWASENPGWKISFLSGHNKELPFTHPVDSYMYKNGFLIMSGKIEEDEAMMLMRAAQKTKLGMSHGFIPLKRNPIEKNVIEKYRTYEASVLAIHKAAFPYSKIGVFSKEFQMNQEELIKQFKSVVGDEIFDSLVKEAGSVEKLLEGIGIASKELDLPDEEKKDEKTPSFEKTPQDIQIIAKALGMDELSDTIAEIKDSVRDNVANMKILAEAIRLQGKQLETQEKDINEQLAERIAPKYSWTETDKLRDSKKGDNLYDEKEDTDLKPPALKDLDPEENWLSVQTNTIPETTPTS